MRKETGGRGAGGGGSQREDFRPGVSRPGSATGGEEGLVNDRSGGRGVDRGGAGRRGAGDVSARRGARVLSGAPP
jgi:hypothetical protein